MDVLRNQPYDDRRLKPWANQRSFLDSDRSMCGVPALQSVVINYYTSWNCFSPLDHSETYTWLLILIPTLILLCLQN
jgi:hypothetical protein